MILNVHDFHNYIGKFLSRFELDYNTRRSEGWDAFSKAVSRERFEDKKYLNNLYPKSKKLRDAAYVIAFLADAFEYIESTELEKEEEE